MSTPALNPLVDKIRAIHPGAYDDMDDATLTKRVLAKYPQYSDLAAPPVPAPPNPISGANKEFLLGGPEPGDTASTDAAVRAGKNIFSGTLGGTSPTPWNIAYQINEKMHGRPFDLTSPIQNAALMMLPGDEVASRPMESASERPFLPQAEATGPGLVSRVGKVLLKKVPGVKLAGDLLDAVRGPEAPPVPVPKPPIPETDGIPWGSGGQGPLSLRGKMIPQEAEPATRPFTPAPRPSSNVAELSQKLDGLLRESVGNKPVQAGVPMKNQGRPFIPEGHTPVESSAVTSFKYDPASQEMHVHAGGKTYTYGGVSQADADAFQSAPSKGKAWQAIQRGNPLVKKNGTPVKPATGRSF